MDRDQWLVFHPDFESPILRAKLEVFLLLTSSLRYRLSELYQAAPVNWHTIVTILAKTVTSQMESVTEPSDAKLIWGRFLNDTMIAKLSPKPISILAEVGARLTSGLKEQNSGMNYLSGANQRALSWIKHLGNDRQIPALANASLYPVRVYYDPQAEQFCASSSQMGGEIGWKLQLKEHAFYGALIPDLILEHEYLSHLIPTCSYLSRSVREIWLSSALLQQHKNASGSSDDNHVNVFLWEKFRLELSRHFHLSDIELYGPLHLDWLALKMSFAAPEVFWRLTARIIDLENKPEKAGLVDRLFKTLAELDDSKLSQALAVQWQDIELFQSAIVLLND